MRPEPSLHQHLFQLEKRLLRADVRRSPQVLADLLADDFIEFGASGHIYNRQAIIDALADERPVRISLIDFRSLQLAPDVALTTYRAIVAGESGVPPEHSLRCSVWKLAGNRWQMLFHQGTPVAEQSDTA